MKEDGVGDLHAEYERLKLKLEQEGLFDANHKKKIPYMPKCIGVLTSNTGAVIRDIINVSTRRNPNVYIKLLPVPVQGQGAGEKIAKAIEIMNEQKLADVIIIARGGGSLEDLWPFNEEVVARAIYNSELPIISAVGHETDFTIADFVSDLRAPTPSAAAELAVPNIEDVKEKINLFQKRYKNSLIRKLELMKLRFQKCMASKAFKDPMQKINEQYMLLDNIVKRMEYIIVGKVKDEKTKMIKNIARLDTLSPLKTLTRGYTITEYNGKIVNSSKMLKNGDKVRLTFSEGNSEAQII